MAKTLLWWLGVRVAVAAACMVTILSLAQLTVHGLLAYYATIPPYTGIG